MATSEQMRGNQNAAGKRRAVATRQHVSISGKRLAGVLASMQQHGDTDVVAATWRLIDQAIAQESEYSQAFQNC